MLVANTFDLWQKDIFFSAAEEVQASADIMESAYRTWVRQKREGISSIAVDELCRELQTALATAKWQLDEFQRAVRMSYRNIDEIRSTRHEQFVSAIATQISGVEEALKEYFSDGVRKPLRWVNLDEDERDDLAMFLSGNQGSSNSTKDSDSDVSHEVLGTSDGSSCDKKASSRRTWGSQDVGTLKITIGHDNEENKSLMVNSESTSKDEGYLWRPRYGNYRINQIFKRAKLFVSNHACFNANNLFDCAICIHNVFQLSMIFPVLINKIKGSNTRG
ncbi:unnamed protein product [Lactuca saligna]|uniref:Syntaxin 6/10/61 N-terminal domain-containing protein n=1 Tax=Lactuca saligna TaxID=75948 RepID=A0AA35ZSM1_LACSI|nr:unnamed protein product [Lactuca saligna]